MYTYIYIYLYIYIYIYMCVQVYGITISLCNICIFRMSACTCIGKHEHGPGGRACRGGQCRATICS